MGDGVVQELLKPILWVNGPYMVRLSVQHGKLLVTLLNGGGYEFHLSFLIFYAVIIIPRL